MKQQKFSTMNKVVLSSRSILAITVHEALNPSCLFDHSYQFISVPPIGIPHYTIIYIYIFVCVCPILFGISAQAYVTSYYNIVGVKIIS